VKKSENKVMEKKRLNADILTLIMKGRQTVKSLAKETGIPTRTVQFQVNKFCVIGIVRIASRGVYFVPGYELEVPPTTKRQLAIPIAFLNFYLRRGWDFMDFAGNVAIVKTFSTDDLSPDISVKDYELEEIMLEKRN
jgi:hypothetical protein